jgi:type IV pilus assembly protein PilM
MVMAKKKTLLGLDIGSSTVKAIELTDVGGIFYITGYAQKPLESKEALVDTIKAVVEEGGFKSKRVATAVSGRSVIVRYVNMMKMADEELRSAIRYEADKYIPFEVEDVVLDCQRLEEAKERGMGENEMKVLLVAVKKSLIEERIAALVSAGLKPVVIDVDCFALGNAFELKTMNSPRFAGVEKLDALVDIGANKTNINIMKKQVSYFTREVYIGGNDFTDAISHRLSLDLQEAESLKVNPSSRDAEVEESTQQAVEDLANEVHLSFDYYESQFDEEVDEVFLSGGGAKLIGLPQIFERAFGKKVSIWDPIEDFEMGSDRVDVNALRENAPRLAIAVGLAARVTG